MNRERKKHPSADPPEGGPPRRLRWVRQQGSIPAGSLPSPPMADPMPSVPAHHWSTDEVPDRPFSYWVETVCDRFLELDIDSPVRQHFHARLDQTQLGPATASWLSADAQRVRRTRAKIASSRPSFLLMQLRTGRVEIRQAGQVTPLRPGECVLLDGAQPYEVECPEPTRSCVLQLSDTWLRGWVSSPE